MPLNIIRATLLAIFLAQSTFTLGFSSAVKIPSLSCRSLVLQSAPSIIDTTVENDLVSNSKVNDLAAQLLSTCTEFGQVGCKLTEDQRATIDNLASALTGYSDSAPAQIDLDGTHELIYSASPGGSSGAIGPLVGKVTQSFLDEVKFINRVELLGGIVKVELHAERQVLDESRIRVKFKETAFSIFGNEVKRGEVKGAGVWDYTFSRKVNIDGENMLLRILKTPSTFIIVQKE
ncbi:hypothetical protein ACHAXR_008487 [Thalassiosira sp. AJA248-18]